MRPTRTGAVLAGVTALALLAGCSSTVSGQGSPAPTTAGETGETTTSEAAPTTTEAAPTTTESTETTTEPTTQPATVPLAGVFPDATTDRCVAGDPATEAAPETGSGVSATEWYVCDYSDVAADAILLLTAWPDAAGAEAWYADTEALGPRVEDFDNWQVGGVEQGPLYTAANSEGIIISTAIYSGLPYSWEIRSATLEDSNAVFDTLQLLDSTQIGG